MSVLNLIKFPMIKVLFVSYLSILGFSESRVYGQSPSCVSCAAGFKGTREAIDCNSSCTVENAQLSQSVNETINMLAESYTNLCTVNSPTQILQYRSGIEVTKRDMCKRRGCAAYANTVQGCLPGGTIFLYGNQSGISSLKRASITTFKKVLNENTSCTGGAYFGSPYLQSFDGAVSEIELTNLPANASIFDFAKEGSGSYETIFAATNTGLAIFNRAATLNPTGSVTTTFNANANTVGQGTRRAVFGVAVTGPFLWISTLGQGIRRSAASDFSGNFGGSGSKDFNRTANSLDTNYGFGAEGFDDGVAAFASMRGAFFVGIPFTNDYDSMRNFTTDDGLAGNSIIGFAKESVSNGARYWISSSHERINGNTSPIGQRTLSVINVVNNSIPTENGVVSWPINLVKINNQTITSANSPSLSQQFGQLNDFQVSAMYGLSIFPITGGNEIWASGFRESNGSQRSFLFRSINSGITWDAWELKNPVTAQKLIVNKISKYNGDIFVGTPDGLFRIINLDNPPSTTPPDFAEASPGSGNSKAVFDILPVEGGTRMLLGTGGTSI